MPKDCYFHSFATEEKFFESPIKFNHEHMLPTDIPEDQAHITTTFLTAKRAVTGQPNSTFKLLDYSLKKQCPGYCLLPAEWSGVGKVCIHFLSGKPNCLTCLCDSHAASRQLEKDEVKYLNYYLLN